MILSSMLLTMAFTWLRMSYFMFVNMGVAPTDGEPRLTYYVLNQYINSRKIYNNDWFWLNIVSMCLDSKSIYSKNSNLLAPFRIHIKAIRFVFSVYKNKVLFTKPFQASQSWHQLSVYENKVLVQTLFTKLMDFTYTSSLLSINKNYHFNAHNCPGSN